VVCQKSGEIFLIFRESYAIRWSYEDSGPLRAFFGNFALANHPPKPFFGRGGQACRIISAYWRIQEGGPPGVGKMMGFTYTLYDNTFGILREIVP
jgi:hypothetical protein